MTTRPAFTTQQIFLAAQGALRARAITELCITAPIRCTVTRADDLRWNDAGQARIAGEWMTLTPLAISALARQERLDWRREDGTVLAWDDTTGGLQS